MSTKTTSEGDDKMLSLLSNLKKTYGSESVIFGNSFAEVSKQSSGVLALNLALGGGFGKGRIVEISGPESSGKTTLCILAMVEAQKENPKQHVAIIDSEHALDAKYCENLGLDMSKVLICQPDNGEQGLNIALDLINSGQISFLLLDSIAAFIPKAVLDGDMEDKTMALHARLITTFIPQCAFAASKTGTIVYLSNQNRNKINTYGNPVDTTGGNALKYYCSQRIELSAKLGEKDGDKNLTHKIVKANVKKNKIAPPFQTCEMRIGFGYGVDKFYDTTETGLITGVLTKSGNSWYYNEIRLGVSKEKAYETLKTDKNLHETIRKEIDKRIKNGTARATTGTDSNITGEPF